jgi:signal recognition particle subunit SRP54
VLDSISGSFRDSFRKLRGKGKLSNADIDNILADIRVALLDADVAVAVVDEFLAEIAEDAQNIEYSKAINPAEQIVKIISLRLQEILGKEIERPLTRAKNGPTVYMLIGLQGAGKTTLAGKLGNFLKKNKHTPLLVAADLQRPGAVKQLEIVGEKAGVPVFAPNPGVGIDGEDEQKKSGLFGGLFGGRDASKAPIDVAKQGVAYAKEKFYDTVIIDTAGRLGVDDELLEQAKNIKEAIGPDEVLFVMDSTTGQDAINSATAFDSAVGFTGAVLTKFDSDTRGGAALSVAKVTGKPIFFQGVGERYEDLEVFHPDRIASRILDQGDILTLLEQAEDKIDTEVASVTAQKLIEGEDFDLNDFLMQMDQIKKMGSIKNLLGMVPGMGQYKSAIDNFDESELTRIEAIVHSMTPYERANPKQINGSRKQRIARGSGVQVSAVNQLLERFTQMQKMMKQMMGGGKKGGRKASRPQNTPNIPSLDALQGIPGDANAAQIGDISANLGLGDMQGLNPAELMQGLNMGLPGGLAGGFGANRTNSNRKSKGKNAKRKGGKSGNPAKRAHEEALMRSKLGLE